MVNHYSSIIFKSVSYKATQYAIPYYETSAKNSKNIDIIFQTMAKNIMQKNPIFNKGKKLTIKKRAVEEKKEPCC